MLFLHNVSVFVGGRPLLNEANFRVNRGDRIGVIGRNGSGKSHLMELLAGTIGPDAGTRSLSRDNPTVLLVKQELPDETSTPLDYLKDHDPDMMQLNAKIDETDDSNELGALYEELSKLEEERYDTEAPKILMGLGLTKAELTRPMSELSGGFRMRIGLAMALIRKPDVLLLDEPTNHLDLESIEWLIEFLKDYPKSAAFVIVTHNIRILTALCPTTVNLRGGVLTEFEGDYTAYKEHLANEESKALMSNKDREKEIKRRTETYHQFRGVASRAAQALGELKKAEALKDDMVEILTEEPVVDLSFAESAPLPSPAVKITDADIGYVKKTVLHDINLSISYGMKIGLLGRNGEGKSTLVKLLAGKLNPSRGELVGAPRLNVAYFSQDLMDELNAELTVYEQFATTTSIRSDEAIRSALGRYGFSRDKVDLNVSMLSGGEKSRLLFALICSRTPNLIIMDEPTNHLDVETREELIRAMNEFNGSIILVSHDWDLHEKTMNQFWLVNAGTVSVYNQGLKEYERVLHRMITDNLKGYSTHAGKDSTKKESHAKTNDSGKSSKSGIFGKKEATSAHTEKSSTKRTSHMKGKK